MKQFNNSGHALSDPALAGESKGFTFLELILYISIVTVMLAAIIPFALNVITGGAKSTVEQEVFSQARYVSERLKYEIRNASNINNGSCPSSTCSNFGVDLATDSIKQISLKETGGSDPTIFNIASGKLMIKQGGASSVEINSTDTNVTSLIFTNYTSFDNKTKHISFTFTLASNYLGQRQEFKETVTLEGSAEVRSN